MFTFCAVIFLRLEVSLHAVNGGWVCSDGSEGELPVSALRHSHTRAQSTVPSIADT